MTRPFVLYNPQAPYYALPLALLAVGSELARHGFEAKIVDGRLDRQPARTILDADPLALGVTVLTGSPLDDALSVTRDVRASSPTLPIVWGGWHPSIFPQSCVEEAPIQAVAIAQGEETAVEIARRLAEGADLADIPGLHAASAPAESRPFRSPDEFARHDYGLLDLEAYFQRKGIRQLEYVSSQGCPFSCGFCSDPMVYRRRWAGLAAERVIDELTHLIPSHGIKDVGFQDEIFFVNAKRSLAIAEGLLRTEPITWTATARVEEILRFEPSELTLLKRSGLRKLVIGAESGEPEVLARIRKGIEAEQIIESARALQRADITGHYNFIVGFPFDESPDEVQTTLRTIRELKGQAPEHEFALFYYAPYPGSPIFEEMARRHPDELPKTLSEWARFDYVRNPGSWMSPSTHRSVEDFKFYRGLAPRASGLLSPLAVLARFRNAHDFYRLPLERLLGNFVRRRLLGQADI